MSITLCRKDDILPEEIKRVELADGRALAIYRLGDEFFATDDLCTHGQAMLSEGMIEGEQVVCPYHLGTFDIRTGVPTGAPCTIALRTYALRIEDGALLVE